MKKRDVKDENKISPNQQDGDAWYGPTGLPHAGHHHPHPVHAPHLGHPPHPSHLHAGHHPHLPPHLQSRHHMDMADFARTGYGNSFTTVTGDILNRVVENRVTEWLLRAISYGPPEMVAIFRAQIATMSHLISVIDTRGINLMPMSSEDVQAGELTHNALSQNLPSNEVTTCLNNLFIGPMEVQSIAIAELINLRLSQIITETDNANTDIDGEV